MCIRDSYYIGSDVGPNCQSTMPTRRQVSLSAVQSEIMIAFVNESVALVCILLFLLLSLSMSSVRRKQSAIIYTRTVSQRLIKTQKRIIRCNNAIFQSPRIYALKTAIGCVRVLNVMNSALVISV